MNAYGIIELTAEEQAQIEGGNPLVVGVLIGVATGFVANYIYESVGGKTGIDSAVSSAWSNYVSTQAFMGQNGAWQMA